MKIDSHLERCKPHGKLQFRFASKQVYWCTVARMTTNSRQLDPIPLTFLQVIDLKLLLFRVHLSSGFFVTFWPYVDDVAGDGSADICRIFPADAEARVGGVPQFDGPRRIAQALDCFRAHLKPFAFVVWPPGGTRHFGTFFLNLLSLWLPVVWGSLEIDPLESPITVVTGAVLKLLGHGFTTADRALFFICFGAT